MPVTTPTSPLAHGGLDDEPRPCCVASSSGDEAPMASCVATTSGGILAAPLPGLDDEEGATVPAAFPLVVDAHVHLFPDGVFRAIWRWFDTYGWPIRYRLTARQVLDHQLARGVRAVVGLTYAHRPGLARELNRFMADLALSEPRLVALGTVLPGEPDQGAVVDEAFALGLRGLKLHCHVQCCAPDDPRLDEVYGRAAERGLPVVIHAGREPKSPGYACDPHALCAAARVERVLRRHPTLKLVVPHFGADEFAAYRALVERYDTLWLDSTMMLADYFAVHVPSELLVVRPDRVLYGSDFPNLPYAWDRELRRLAAQHLEPDVANQILSGTAAALFEIDRAQLAPG